jgi:C4-dicarboxylate transporter DctM subunit
MEPLLVGVVATVVMTLLLAVGVHVAIALAAVTLVGLSLITSVHATLSMIVNSFYTSTSDYSFVVLPLFIIMGNFAASSGVTEKAYNFASKWLSQFRGGLYLVTITACALFAAVSGSGTATTLAIGKTVLPEMEKYGYNRRLSVACVACSGTLGVLIPPSIVMVIYGIVTEEPVGPLLIAGIIPGILSALIYMVGIYIMVSIKPTLAPATVSYSWKERFKSIPGLWGVALLFGGIIGGIYAGVFTPNEAAAVGAVVAFILLVMRNRGNLLSEVKKAAWDAAMTVAMMFFIVIAATVFTKFLTVAGVLDVLLSIVKTSHLSPSALVVFFIAVCVVFGMFLSATAALLLLAPLAHNILVPLGFDGIWLGVIMVKMFELAVITPPIGLNVYIAKTLVPELEITDVFRGIGVFAFMELITVTILVIFPQLSLWLPSLMFK